MTPSICLPLKEQYEPCSNDYDCLYGKGCYSGICIEYGKIDNGDEIYADYCINGASPFCEDEQCFIFSNGVAKCIEVLETSGKTNAFCSDNLGCQSKYNKRVGGVVVGKCQCGINELGTSYCSNFLGDGYTKSFVKFLQSCGEGSNIQKCNIDVSFSSACIRSRGGKSQYNEFIFLQFMSQYQAIVHNGLSCALKVLAPTFYTSDEQLFSLLSSTSFASILSVSLVGILLS